MNILGTLLGLSVLVPQADARRREAEPQQDPCGPDKVYASTEALNPYKYMPGYGAGTSQADALSGARFDARAALLAELGCDEASFGATEYCDAVRSNIEPWAGNSRQDSRRRWEACATAALPRDFLTQLQDAAHNLELDMATLASDVARAADGHRLKVVPAKWKSGCPAGPEGMSLIHSMERSFGALPPDQQPNLHAGGWSNLGPDDRRLLLELNERHGTVEVVAWLVSPTECTRQPVGTGLSFPSYLLDVPDDEYGRCAKDELLGITNYGRCAGDLQVELDVPSDSGVICPGMVVSPTVRVNQRARVQVYSVAPDGQSELVFPMDGASGIVEGELSLGDFDAVHAEGGEQDRLVAMAVAADQDFELTRGWQGYCQVPGKWRPGLIPTGAAVTTSAFTIPAPNSAACAAGPSVQRQHSAAPRCGH